jgi:hypothetical protein
MANKEDVGFFQRHSAEGAIGRSIGPRRLERLACLPVRALHRPRHHVLEAAEHGTAVTGVLGGPKAV